MKLDEWHTARKVPIFLKAQSIIESSEKYSVEEIIAVDKELHEYSKQIDKIRNEVYALAYIKWSKLILDNLKK